uniref:Uncharacterized protein n=1 Tax=Anguilla anguilla TaxID=7936 RepID=A0A0E9U998_ANGAN
MFVMFDTSQMLQLPEYMF